MGLPFDTSLTSCTGVGVKLVGCGGGGGGDRPSSAEGQHQADVGLELARVQDDRQALGFQGGALRRHHVQER